jgi:delta 1-pyrroline-5-carboxylate dehydrogenase
MAYLVRRLLENTSNESFIRHRFAEGLDLDALLAGVLNHLEVHDDRASQDPIETCPGVSSSADTRSFRKMLRFL